jgi:hypothetical protein
MQTHADFRIGTLVRWNGDDANGADIDELGIVVQLPRSVEEGGKYPNQYHIAWAISNATSHHSPEMIEESLYQSQIEIIR